MASIRVGMGWTAAELVQHLEGLRALERNFAEQSIDEMSIQTGWRSQSSEALVARESPGPPLRAGPFARAKELLTSFSFSDPSIVRAHYDPHEELLGRRMLLDLQAVGVHLLCGTVVVAVRDATEHGASHFGFRYDTLEGHPERGLEWFVLTKEHSTGEIRFCIRSRWREADLRNWWVQLGFSTLAPYYRRRWLRRAHQRLAKQVRPPLGHVLQRTSASTGPPLREKAP